MKIYYTASGTREALFAEVLAREDAQAFLPHLAQNAHGKPYFRIHGAPFFNLTDTHGLIAMAIGECEMGLDAERRIPRKSDAIRARLTSREREEDFFLLWTAKEAFVKFSGSTLAAMLPRLEYAKGQIFLGGEKMDVCLQHFYVEDAVLCLCTEKPVACTLVPLALTPRTTCPPRGRSS